MVRKFRKFGRRRMGRRRRGGGGFWKNFGRNYRTVSTFTNPDVIWTAIEKLQGLVNSEMFKLDQSNTGQSATNGGSVVHITAVAQGDGSGARTGNSILARSINIKGTANFNSAGAAQQYVKLMIIKDKQQVSDTAPTVGDIVDVATSYGHLNASTVGRYQILKSVVLPALSLYRPGMPWTLNVPLKSHVRYNGTTASDVQRGGMYFVFMSNSSANYPTIDYNCRLSYHDN